MGGGEGPEYPMRKLHQFQNYEGAASVWGLQWGRGDAAEGEFRQRTTASQDAPAPPFPAIPSLP